MSKSDKVDLMECIKKYGKQVKEDALGLIIEENGLEVKILEVLS